MPIWYTYFDTRIGTFHAAFTRKGLCELALSYSNEQTFIEHLQKQFGTQPTQDDGLVRHLVRNINSYLDGARVAWNFDIDISWASKFRQAVWQETRKVPYGTTVSYWELACRVGNRRAARAVGAAMAANPLLLVVPCHRVVGSNGNLVGFGCGLELKERLLRLEGAIA